MWAQNHEAATAHLSIIRHLVTQFGGLSKLDFLLHGKHSSVR